MITIVRWTILYGIPVAWIAASLAVLRVAYPVLSRFYDIATIAEDRAIREPNNRNLLAARLAHRDYRTRRLIAMVPTMTTIIGVIVLLPLPMPIVRVVATGLFFTILWFIGFKFYAENRDYAWEERRLERSHAADYPVAKELLNGVNEHLSEAKDQIESAQERIKGEATSAEEKASHHERT